MIEEVSGVIIGGEWKTARLFTPSGHEVAHATFDRADSDDEIKEWAKAEMDKRKTEVGPDETKRLGWTKNWELRIYD
jgi:hypothetical protein